MSLAKRDLIIVFVRVFFVLAFSDHVIIYRNDLDEAIARSIWKVQDFNLRTLVTLCNMFVTYNAYRSALHPLQLAKDVVLNELISFLNS